MATVIDSLVLELGIDGTKFKQDAGAAKKQTQELKSGFTGASESFKSARGAAAAFFTVIAAAAGLDKLVDKVTELNVKLGSTSKNLGMSTQALKEWQNVAELAGGSAEGITSTMQSFSKAQTEMSVTGQSAMLPYMRALGVSMFDAGGKARPLNDMLLDLSDRFSAMDRVQANNFGQMMGIDQDTMNVLMQGRGAMADMIELQKSLHKSTEEEVRASKELAQAKKLLSMQFESLGTIIANAITPVVTKMVKVITSFVDFLNKHEKFTKAFFLGIASAITIALLPALWSAAAAVFTLIAPFLAAGAAVAALAAAFGLLYDDYQTWAEGGKSLFDWSEFKGFIDGAGDAAGRTNKAFLKLIGGYQDWSEVGRTAFDWLKFKGFIDDNGVSVNSLRTGFVNLAKDIMTYLAPTMQFILGVWDKLKSGDFSGAWSDIKAGGNVLLDKINQFADWGDKKITDFVNDVKDPNFGKNGNTGSDVPLGGSTYTSTGGNTTSAGIGGMKSLGSLSAKYEGNVGSANRDNIGYAYGKYQFNESTGGLQAFMRAAPEYAAKFRGLSAGTSEFAAKWREIAKADPKGFEAAQDKAAAAKWFSPAANHANKLGFKMQNRGLQEAVFSGSIQHGGINKVLSATAKTPGFANMSPEDQIRAYYAARSRYVETNMSSKDPNRARTIAQQKNRYANEQRDALALSIATGGSGQSAADLMRSGMQQASNAGRSSMVANNSAKTVNVHVGQVSVQTSANTIAGNVGAAHSAIRDRVTQIESGLV